MSYPLTPNLLLIFTFTAATLAIYAGLVLPKLLRRWMQSRRTLFIGAGTGVLLATFLDLTKETAGIGTSTLSNLTDVANLIAFAMGLLVFLIVPSSAGRGAARYGSIALLYLWALLGLGFHGAGEGIVIGYNFLTGATVLSAFQITSYLLHKIGEGFTVGLLLVEGNHTWRDGTLSGLFGGVPILFGVLGGLSGLPGIIATVLFAVGAGATVYLVIEFAALAGSPRSQVTVGVLSGFLYMFLAGVLHQFP